MSTPPSRHRVRFAPSPSGRMHLGNIRTAVLNYLCALQSSGTFILRIEDTDQERTFQECFDAIFNDLTWLSLTPDEGPKQGGPYEPYVQSERTSIYRNYLDKLVSHGNAYRCFATKEKLDQIRAMQTACKLPPRYDREQCRVSSMQEAENLQNGIPYVWRLKLPEGTTFIEDKARGLVTYDFKNFSDCPLTRQDGSFTFLFANFVDDVEMKISYIIRGEDHMSNTAIQAAMYDIFRIKKPLFYHTPIICNNLGQKLSKRDFGFSLQDLISEGYLPEAINNYLILIGSSFNEEIFSVDEAATKSYFDQIKSTGSVQYNVEKLNWINKKWIQRLSLQDFIDRSMPFLSRVYSDIELKNIPHSEQLMTAIKKESSFLKDPCKLIEPFLKTPNNELMVAHHTTIKTIIKSWDQTSGYEGLSVLVKKHAIQNNSIPKELWSSFRLLLTGSETGMSLKDIISLLPIEEIEKRVMQQQ